MNTCNIDNARYTILKAVKGVKPLFINMADEAAVEAVRNRFGNSDLLISACYYTGPHSSAERIYPLRFHIVSSDLEKARVSALEACYYINERRSIPLDCQEITHAAGADIADNYIAGDSSKLTATDVTGTATAAEMVIIVPPIVLGGQPTALMPAINYQLAREMAEDGVPSIDVDVYEQNHFIPLPNSLRGSRYVIHLTVKELLSLDAGGISELTKNPRPEDSLIMPRFIPEAAERFAGTCAEFEKKHCQQDKLRALILKNWQIPPCIRRLSWADLETNTALEACRVISGFFSFIHARNDEIWHHVLRLARRNSVNDQQRLRAIVTFAIENRTFMGCGHPLLRQYCLPGRCFMTELIEECENPLLFELRGEQE